MVARRKVTVEADDTETPNDRKFARYVTYLAIDPEDLDECLIQQPELYFHVADAHALVMSERDAIKLALEEAEAEEDRKIREHAIQHDIKTVEGQIKAKVQLSKTIKELKRDLIEANMWVKRWAALEGSFAQRKSVMGELVTRYMSKMAGGSVTVERERFAQATRHRLEAARTRKQREREDEE